MATIEAAHYAEARTKFMNDPIVQTLAKGLTDVPLDKLAHADGSPRWEFMQGANNEYGKRGGKFHAHIGAVAEALLLILKNGVPETKKEATVDTKTVTILKTITFELISDGISFDVEVRVKKEDFGAALDQIMAMRHSRNIRY